MNAIQKRIKALKNPTKQRIFTAWTGLTFDMNKLDPAKLYWYYPRGAAFRNCYDDMDIDDSSDDSSDSSEGPTSPADDTESIQTNLAQNIDENGADFSGDDSTDKTPTTIDVITVQNSDGTQSVITTSDGRIIETND